MIPVCDSIISLHNRYCLGGSDWQRTICFTVLSQLPLSVVVRLFVEQATLMILYHKNDLVAKTYHCVGDNTILVGGCVDDGTQQFLIAHELAHIYREHVKRPGVEIGELEAEADDLAHEWGFRSDYWESAAERTQRYAQTDAIILKEWNARKEESPVRDSDKEFAISRVMMQFQGGDAKTRMALEAVLDRLSESDRMELLQSPTRTFGYLLCPYDNSFARCVPSDKTVVVPHQDSEEMTACLIARELRGILDSVKDDSTPKT